MFAEHELEVLVHKGSKERVRGVLFLEVRLVNPRMQGVLLRLSAARERQAELLNNRASTSRSSSTQQPPPHPAVEIGTTPNATANDAIFS